MTETELERLVVRLTGDGSSYQRMTAMAVEGNKTLSESMKKVEASQKQMDTQLARSNATWKENSRGIDDTTNALKRFATETTTARNLWEQYKNSIRTGISEIKGQLVDLGFAYGSSLGMFDQNKSWWQRGAAYLNPGTYVRTVSSGAAGVIAGLPTVLRDQSTYTAGPGGSISINPSTRRLTASQAEEEDYIKSLLPYRQSIKRDEREHRRSVGEEEIRSIENRNERMARMKDTLSADMSEESQSRRITTRLSRRLEGLERNWYGRATAMFGSAIAGVSNPYEADINKTREERDKSRKDTLDIEERRRRTARSIEDSMRADERGDANLIKRMNRRNATFGMTDQQEQLYNLQQAGTPMGVIHQVAMAMSRHNELSLSKGLADEETERGYIGMTPRKIRDAKTSAEMKRQGYSQPDIDRQLQSFQKTDKAEDAEELASNIKKLTAELNSQTQAYRNSTNVMQPYLSLLDKITDSQKRAALEASIKSTDLERRASIFRDSDPHEMFRREQQSINELHDNNMISMGQRDKALSNARRSIFGSRGGLDAPSGGVYPQEYGSSDALTALEQFRSMAFGGRAGDGASGGGRSFKQRRQMARDRAMSPLNKRRARYQAALAKTSVRGSSSRRDPTAGMISDMLGDDMAPYREDSLDIPFTAPRLEADMGPLSSLSRGGMSIHEGGASDYWGMMEKRTKSDLFGSPDEDPTKLLKRIAEASEKEADIKISASGLK